MISITYFAVALVRNQLGQGQNNLTINLVQYFSSEEGKKALALAMQQIDSYLSNLNSNSAVSIQLVIDGKIGAIYGNDHLIQLSISIIESLAPPNKVGF